MIMMHTDSSQFSFGKQPSFGRAGFAKRALFAAALAWLAQGCARVTSASEDPPVPPSVIVISLDTLRYDRCGFNGYTKDTTPFLDKLSAESIVFDRAYTTMSWTLIAHMSMLTGLYPTQHGVIEADLALDPGFPTLAERLASEGYQTAGVHFPGWLDPRFGFDRGHESYAAANDAEAADLRLASITQGLNPDWPYFLFVHLFDIHSGEIHLPGSTIYEPPAPFDSMFMRSATAELQDIEAMRWWEESCSPTEAQHDAVNALYDGGIRYVDSKLEAWFTDWEKRGLLDNTIIVVTSDHGEGLRQRDMRYGGHGNMFEEGLRIPLLVRLPDGARGGERISSLASLVDIVPTVLQAAGLPGDDRLPGISLVSQERSDDEWVFAARAKARAAISKSRKIEYVDDVAHRLFRLDEDPLEEHPITRREQGQTMHEVVQPMLDNALAQLASYFQPAPPITAEELDPRSRDALRGLGYGGEVGR